jgi:hypothetical protein
MSLTFFYTFLGTIIEEEKMWLFLQDDATANYFINILSEMFEDGLISRRLCGLQGLQTLSP